MPIGSLPLNALLHVPADVCDVTPQQSVWLESGPYRVRLAATDGDRAAAFRLRFIVFNLELNEGLESAYEDGYDTDRYDAVCDHLIVEHCDTGLVVGTYRLQAGEVAKRNFGYYSEQEFDFDPYESLREETVELGRACIHRAHRSTEVLNLLWKGIARYVIGRGGRYMIGCCSLPSLEPATGMAVYGALKNYMAEPRLMTVATEHYRLPHIAEMLPGKAEPPKLLRAYLAIGAKLCSEPAIDREFKTIDFLTLLDLQSLHPRIAARFLDGY